MSTFYGVDQRWALYIDARAKVLDRFTAAQNAATVATNEAIQSINSLQSLAAALAGINTAYTLASVYSAPSDFTENKPNIDTGYLSFTKPSSPVEPSMPNATPESAFFNTLFLTLPAIDPGNISTYTSTLLSALQAKLLSDLQSGSIGLSPEVENAIFNREYERDLLIHNDSMDRIAAQWAKSGYPIPNGALQGAYEEEQINYDNKRYDRSRDIMIKSFELAVENSHFIISRIVEVEHHLITWANWVAERIYQASKTTGELAISGFNAQVAQNRESAMIAIDRSKTMIEYLRSQIALSDSRVNSFLAQIRGEADRIHAIAAGYNANTGIFKAIVDYDTQKYSLTLSSIKTHMDEVLSQANVALHSIDLGIKMEQVLNSIKAECWKAAAMASAELNRSELATVHVSSDIHASDHSTYGYRAPASVDEAI